MGCEPQQAHHIHQPTFIWIEDLLHESIDSAAASHSDFDSAKLRTVVSAVAIRARRSAPVAVRGVLGLGEVGELLETLQEADHGAVVAGGPKGVHRAVQLVCGLACARRARRHRCPPKEGTGS